MVTAEVFKALGDPTRLEIIQRLTSGDTYSITEATENLKLTRQGARKHLQILADAKLVRLQDKGRTTSVQLDGETLRRSKEFIAQMEQRWDARLARLKTYVEK